VNVTLTTLPLTGLVGRVDYLGTEDANGEPSRTWDERRRRCYELAGHALAFGTAPLSAVLVHGSWHGPGARQRIGHAWLEHGERAWEPVTAAWYPLREFLEATSARPEVKYGRGRVHRNIDETGHYGRWHRSEHP
jgi:hypothetical protein